MLNFKSKKKTNQGISPQGIATKCLAHHLYCCNEDHLHKEAINIYRRAFRIKLNDIFARGFTVPDQMQSTRENSAVDFYLDISGLLSLHEILIMAATSSHCQKYTMVFNADYELPGIEDKFLGFTTESQIIDQKDKEYYDNIDERLHFEIKVNDEFFEAFIYLVRYAAMSEMIFKRAVSSQKTIMSTNSSNFLGTNSQGQPNVPWLEGKEADGDAYNKSGIEDILFIPDTYTLTMPTADMTQLDIANKTVADNMLAAIAMPATKFFGFTPSGFQNTGQLDITMYEQSLDRICDQYLRPILINIAEVMGLKPQISFISYYKLSQLDKINNVRVTANSSVVEEYCDNMIADISGIRDPVKNTNEEEEVIVEENEKV